MKRPSLPDPPKYLFLALTPEQVRMLVVYTRVPLGEDGQRDIRVWARMASLPLEQVRTLERSLEEMGAIAPDGTMNEGIRNYLGKLANDELTGKRRRA